MTPNLDPRKALLVEGTDAALASVGGQLRKAMGALDLELAEAVEGELGPCLESLRQTAPATILFGPEVVHLGRLVREFGNLLEGVHFLFLQPRNQQLDFQRQLQRLPLGGSQWTLLTLDGPALGEELANAVRATRHRLRMRTVIDRVNTELSGLKGRQEDNHRRVVIADHYLSNFLVHAQDAIVAFDAADKVLYWSAGAERLFGLHRKDAVGAHLSDLPFWDPRLVEHLNRLRAGEEASHEEVACALPDRQAVVEIGFSAVRDDAGTYIGASLIIRDVSARHKQLEAERAQSRAVTRVIDMERRHLRALFEQAPGFIAVTRGPEHVFDVANDAYYQIVGHRSILGKPVHKALPEMEGQEFLNLLDQVYRTGEAYVGRGTAVTVQKNPGGSPDTLFVDFVFQPIIEEDGSVAGVFCQGSDVTEHRQTQEKLAQHQKHLEKLVAERTQALERSQRALHRSQKLEAIGKLTGGVAHDFNNVLQIIAGNLQLLQAELAGQESAEKYLGSAVEAVDRGAKLSSQLLAFARRQPLQPATVNLGRILRDMDDLLRRALGETIEIETIVAGGLWNTMVDPNQLENVILNLSINARDAMPDGGKLTLELGNAMLDDQYVLSQPDVMPGQYVMLAISDTGKGMSPEVMERAFDPFFTTKKEGEGTGLGLSMAYGFVKQSGGHIKIYSEPGSGTTFRIYLPRSHQPEVKPQHALAGPVVGGTETILVVEDDASVQETVVRMLDELGYKVLKASDAQSALNILQSGLAIDMLFTDVVMPGPISSPELAKQAKRIFPQIAVLFTSGYTQNAIVHGGRLDPGVELLSKPYRREDLARKIRHVFANVRHALPSDLTLRDLGQASDVDTESFRVLVVEDDRDSRTAVCELLSLLDHRARGVGSAEEARRALAEEPFDLLFTDVNLPGMSGVELAQKALQHKPSLKVILASGYGSALAEPLPASAVVLPKPFDLERLRHALAATIA